MVFGAPLKKQPEQQLEAGTRSGQSGAGVTPPIGAAQQAAIKHLQQCIHGVETAQRVDAGETISSGCASIDQLLPGGGYAKGVLVQWLSAGGYGVDYLSLLTAREACRDGGALVIVDPQQQFYPPAAAAMGINMGNLIVLREPTSSPRRGSQGQGAHTAELNSDWLWSIDQALRCSAVGAVWGALPAFNERWFRRFQLSAESSGCLGLFLQSLQEARQPSWAEVQWLVTPRPSSDRRPAELSPKSARGTTARQQSLQIQMTRCRGARTGKKLLLNIDAVTGQVS